MAVSIIILAFDYDVVDVDDVDVGKIREISKNRRGR
jgi:hypothetical protein